jgi:hypothetical protein
LKGGKIYIMIILIKRKSNDVNIKVDFWAKNITGNTKGHFLMTKGSINQEDTVILYT